MKDLAKPPELVLDYRDALQTRLAARALEGAVLDAEHLMASIYTTTKRGSFHKTFSRDRKALAKQGIFIEETSAGRTKQWSLDERATRADLSGLEDSDARVAAELGRATLNNLAASSKTELGCAVARVGRGLTVGTGTTTKQLDKRTALVFEHLQQALAAKKPCRLAYTGGTDKDAERIFCPWGFFEYAGALYAVGERIKDGAAGTRTYKLSRAESATMLPDEPSYEIPRHFNVSEYRFLPFEIGEEEPRTIRLFVPKDAAKLFRDKAHGRGTFEQPTKGSFMWSHTARSIERAARWAIEAGGIPVEPPELKDAWTQIMEAAIEEGDEHA